MPGIRHRAFTHDGEAVKHHKIKWEQDGSLTFRRSCGHGVCGSDAMSVNGLNRLACKLLMGHLPDKIIIMPLLAFRVIKDLVVDLESFFA